MVGEQPEVSIGWDEGEDPLGFPALEPNTWVETDIIQQPWILRKKCSGSGRLVVKFQKH